MKLDALAGRLSPLIMAEVVEATEKYNANTTLRLAHFLAQCSHESDNFRLVRENLNYSSEGLKNTFKKYFPTEALAIAYARQPEKIANRVYANRMGNGDENSGDGWKYRGRGYIQLTGKDNYKAFGDFIKEDILSNPDLVATKYPLTSAIFFFNNKKIWDICDKGDSDTVVTEVTEKVNGGRNGLEDRLNKFKTYKNLI
jgi:putative chitinase